MKKTSSTRRALLRLAASAAVLGTVTAMPLAAQAAGKPVVIGSMIWNASVPFYSNFIKGQQQTADKLDAKLVLVDGKGDLGTEIAGVQQLISQHVDAILITASDAKGIVPVVKMADKAGIPVFAVNNRVDDAGPTVTFIGADDYEFGRQQAALLVSKVGPNARVAYMLGGLGTSAQLQRQKGFDDYLKAYPKVTIVTSQTANWDAAQALRLVQDWLNKYPKGGIDAIVDQGPEAANAARYAHDHGRDDIKFVLGDYPREVREGIEGGYVTGTVDQDPKPQGERSVEAAVQWVAGQKDKVKRPNEFMPLPIVTKDNVAQFPPAWGG
ncbi:sugar ABC transporter substrate-binding protein [Paraburkholderia sp. HP33-1]|uniref:sugar ABC transporter substrate-binding protein n=1 Tax=Paraburkholderia sp. HP33-1 TaxID=2883243 RepID=UPI001F392B42|nr:sugar ABC transporter substrate-binding protein [Paraburkholderia sp. HP33-1]